MILNFCVNSSSCTPCSCTYVKKGLHLYRTHVLVIESEKNVCLKKLVKSFIFLYRMLNLKSIL